MSIGTIGVAVVALWAGDAGVKAPSDHLVFGVGVTEILRESTGHQDRARRRRRELLKLGIGISEREVSRLMPRAPRKPPSQTWRTFLTNHVGTLASIDFFTVPTATFACSTSSSSWRTTADASCIST